MERDETASRRGYRRIGPIGRDRTGTPGPGACCTRRAAMSKSSVRGACQNLSRRVVRHTPLVLIALAAGCHGRIRVATGVPGGARAPLSVTLRRIRLTRAGGDGIGAAGGPFRRRRPSGAVGQRQGRRRRTGGGALRAGRCRDRVEREPPGRVGPPGVEQARKFRRAETARKTAAVYEEYMRGGA